VLQENIAGARLVKAFVRGKHEAARFEVANDALAQENVRIMQIMASMSPILTMIIDAGIMLVVWLGGRHAMHGTLTLGQIIAFTNYLMATLHPLIQMTQLSNNWANGVASAKRINEVLDAVPEVMELANAVPLPLKFVVKLLFPTSRSIIMTSTHSRYLKISPPVQSLARLLHC